MSKFTKRELETIVAALALDKGLDFLTGGAIVGRLGRGINRCKLTALVENNEQ